MVGLQSGNGCSDIRCTCPMLGNSFIRHRLVQLARFSPYSQYIQLATTFRKDQIYELSEYTRLTGTAPEIVDEHQHVLLHPNTSVTMAKCEAKFRRACHPAKTKLASATHKVLVFLDRSPCGNVACILFEMSFRDDSANKYPHVEKWLRRCFSNTSSCLVSFLAPTACNCPSITVSSLYLGVSVPNRMASNKNIIAISGRSFTTHEAIRLM